MSWATFGSKVKIDETTFNKMVAGSSSMKAGFHKNVKVAGIEILIGDKVIRNQDGEELAAFRVTYENDEGQSKNQTVFMEGKNRDTGEDEPGFAYVRFIHAIAGNTAEGFKLLNAISSSSNPEHIINGLVGARVNINVGLPREGYTVKISDNGAYFVRDIKTDEDWAEGKVFSSMDEACEYAKEEGVRLKFNTVLGVHSPDEEFRAINEEVISSATGSKNAAAKPPVQAVNSNGF